MRKMISILSGSLQVYEPMLYLRVENNKFVVGDLVKIKSSVFDLVENQIGVVTVSEGNKVVINMLGHNKPVTIPDVRDWSDIIEVINNNNEKESKRE